MVTGEDIRDIEGVEESGELKGTPFNSMRSKVLLIGMVYFMGMIVISGTLIPATRRVLAGTTETPSGLEQSPDNESDASGPFMDPTNTSQPADGTYMPPIPNLSIVNISTEDGLVNVAWEMTYTTEPDESLFASLSRREGGFVFAGRTRDYDEEKNVISRLWMVSMDSSGDVLWDRFYDAVEPSWLEEGYEGGFILGGSVRRSTEAGSRDLFYLAGLNQGGDIVWELEWGEAELNRISGVVHDNTGGYYIAGTTGRFAAGSQDVYAGRVDGQGFLAWNRTFGGTSHDSAHCVAPSGEGGCLIAGYSDSFGGSSRRIYMIRIDEDEEVIWERDYGQHSWNEAQDVIGTPDGGFIIVGKSSSDDGEAYILRVDRQGSPVWERLYTGSVNSGFKDVVRLEGGDYLAAGYYYADREGPAEIYLVQFDDDGNTIWQTTLPNRLATMAYTREGGLLLSVDIEVDGGRRDASITKVEIVMDS